MRKHKSNINFDLKTLFVQHRSPHHAKKSGYDSILNYYLNAETIGDNAQFPYKIAKLLAYFNSQKFGLYNTDSVYKEIALFKKLKALKSESNLVHYLNGERDIRHVIHNKNWFKNTRFTATFHKPPNVLDWRISKTKYVQLLDGAVAVGVNQIDYLKETFKIPNVAYIPHGINTQFFTPEIAHRRTNRLLFVGQHLRDFEALNFCVPRIAEKIKDLSVHVVVHSAYQKKIFAHDCVTIYSNINDDDLKREYQEASLLFLPMQDSTACNSLLESLACGLPIVTTNVGGNAKYLENTNSLLLPENNYEALIEETILLLNNEFKINELSLLARKKAMDYDWSVIAKQMQSFHESLF